MFSNRFFTFFIFAGIIGTVFYVLHPNRKHGFGEIGLDRELHWRASVGLPVQDEGLPEHLSVH